LLTLSIANFVPKFHHAVALRAGRPISSETKLTTIVVKDLLVLSGYKAKLNLRQSSDQDRLDPEPGRTPAPRMGPVRFRGIQSIGDSADSSTKIFCTVFHLRNLWKQNVREEFVPARP
jgi:hypothetical protein